MAVSAIIPPHFFSSIYLGPSCLNIVVLAYGNALILILVLALEEPNHTALVEFVVKVYVSDN